MLNKQKQILLLDKSCNNIRTFSLLDFPIFSPKSVIQTHFSKNFFPETSVVFEHSALFFNTDSTASVPFYYKRFLKKILQLKKNKKKILKRLFMKKFRRDLKFFSSNLRSNYLFTKKNLVLNDILNFKTVQFSFSSLFSNQILFFKKSNSTKINSTLNCISFFNFILNVYKTKNLFSILLLNRPKKYNKYFKFFKIAFLGFSPFGVSKYRLKEYLKEFRLNKINPLFFIRSIIFFSKNKKYSHFSKIQFKLFPKLNLNTNIEIFTEKHEKYKKKLSSFLSNRLFYKSKNRQLLVKRGQLLNRYN